MIRSRETDSYEPSVEFDFRRLIEKENISLCGYTRLGGGILPQIQVGSLKWSHRADALGRQGHTVRILELGAGDDSAAWTGGISGDRMNDDVLDLRNKGIVMDVTTQSMNGSEKWNQTHGVQHFVPGHFIEVLESLKTSGYKYDLVLSKDALYQSAALYEALRLIDDLLSDEGTAYLEDFIGGLGRSRIVIFPSGNAFVPALIYPDAIRRRQIYFKKFLIPGLEYTDAGETMHIGFTKGQFDCGKLPKFRGISRLADDSLEHRYYALYEAT